MMKARRKSPVDSVSVESHYCSIDLRLKILGRVPFLKSLSAEALEAINQQFVEFGYHPGEIIYLAGDPVRRFYVVADGKVKLLQHTLDGHNVLLDFLIPGEFFGSLEAREGQVYQDTAQAHTSICVLSTPTVEFRNILDAYPQAALRVLDLTMQRLQDAHQKVLHLSSMDVEQRIASTLLKLAEKLGRPHEGGVLIDVPLSRDDLAKMSGTTAETASRVIRQLQSLGLIRSGRQWISVTNLTKLDELIQLQ
jgi:CRP/FNR family transcriptional regulator, nitrogen oxide reductase regulator